MSTPKKSEYLDYLNSTPTIWSHRHGLDVDESGNRLAFGSTTGSARSPAGEPG